MTIDFATIKAAIKSWAAAQSGISAIWRDEANSMVFKPVIKLHLHTVQGLGVDYLGWDYDDTLDPPDEEGGGGDYVPTVSGNRLMVLSIQCETRNQHGNNSALYYLEKLRTSLKKPSVRSGLYAACVVVTSTEATQDLSDWTDDRTESLAQLDVHLSTVVNNRDESEADSYADKMNAQGVLEAPSGTDFGFGPEDFDGDI